MKNVAGFVKREFKHMLPPTLFFLATFNLMALSAQLSREPVTYLTYATATFAALICGKAVLIADKLPFFNRYPDRPLIWNVVWKTFLYMAITLLIRVAELMLNGWLDSRHLGAGLEHALGTFSLPRFIMVQLWLLALFLVYTAFSELVLLVGRERMVRLFFGPVEPRDA